MFPSASFSAILVRFMQIPLIQDGKEVYDRIMREIEPDLCSDVIDTIDTKYPHETEEENAARMERYKNALIRFQEEYEKYQQQRKEEIRSFGKNLVKSVEQKSVTDEKDTMSDLESAISNA